jgi:20S proteasome subunit alpha 7
MGCAGGREWVLGVRGVGGAGAGGCERGGEGRGGGRTAVGVRCKDGVVLGVEKLMPSRLLVKSSHRQVYLVDEHVGVAYAGRGADGRVLSSIAQNVCRQHRRNFGIPIAPLTLAQQMADVMYSYTSYGAYRPFGASLLIAGQDLDSGAGELYLCEVDGSYFRYFGAAIGKGTQAAKTEIEKEKLFDKTCREVVVEIARIMHTVHDSSKDKPFELELAWVCEESGWKFGWVPEDIRTAANEEGLRRASGTAAATAAGGAAGAAAPAAGADEPRDLDA